MLHQLACLVNGLPVHHKLVVCRVLNRQVLRQVRERSVREIIVANRTNVLLQLRLLLQLVRVYSLLRHSRRLAVLPHHRLRLQLVLVHPRRHERFHHLLIDIVRTAAANHLLNRNVQIDCVVPVETLGYG